MISSASASILSQWGKDDLDAVLIGIGGARATIERILYSEGAPGAPIEMGEPAPGRSALDARLRGDEAQQERDGSRATPVNLARIPSLERPPR